MAECWTGWVPILLQEVPPNLNNYDFISVFRLLTFSESRGVHSGNISGRSLSHAYRKDSRLQMITNLLTWENMGEVFETLLKYCHIAKLTDLSNHFCP